jgi:hypothetical protein
MDAEDIKKLMDRVRFLKNKKVSLESQLQINIDQLERTEKDLIAKYGADYLSSYEKALELLNSWSDDDC